MSDTSPSNVVHLSASDAFAVLSNIEATFAKAPSPMPQYQNAIGEMLRSDLPEHLKLHALKVLSDLVIEDPAIAEKDAVRRMAKFITHGPQTKQFSTFEPSEVMTNAVNALSGYVSHVQPDHEQFIIFLNAADAAMKFGVPQKKATNLSQQTINSYYS